MSNDKQWLVGSKRFPQVEDRERRDDVSDEPHGPPFTDDELGAAVAMIKTNTRPPDPMVCCRQLLKLR